MSTHVRSSMYVYFSGMFPLYKPGASSMGGAYLRAHVTAKPQFGKVDQVRFYLCNKDIASIMNSRIIHSLDATMIKLLIS